MKDFKLRSCKERVLVSVRWLSENVGNFWPKINIFPTSYQHTPHILSTYSPYPQIVNFWPIFSPQIPHVSTIYLLSPHFKINILSSSPHLVNAKVLSGKNVGNMLMWLKCGRNVETDLFLILLLNNSFLVGRMWGICWCGHNLGNYHCCSHLATIYWRLHGLKCRCELEYTDGIENVRKDFLGKGEKSTFWSPVVKLLENISLF